jgi:hypothetical protein
MMPIQGPYPNTAILTLHPNRAKEIRKYGSEKLKAWLDHGLRVGTIQLSEPIPSTEPGGTLSHRGRSEDAQETDQEGQADRPEESGG